MPERIFYYGDVDKFVLITSFEKPADASRPLRARYTSKQFDTVILKKQYFRTHSGRKTHKAMKELTDKLAAIKAQISEEDQVVTLLRSLPSNFSSLVTALEARDTISLTYVQQSLIREEQRLGGDRSIPVDVGSGRALLEKQDRAKDKKTSYSCGETGHFRKDCLKNRHKKSFKPKPMAKPMALNRRVIRLCRLLFTRNTKIS